MADHAAWAAKVKGRIAALRDSKNGKAVDLTQREADASGETSGVYGKALRQSRQSR
jgi:hypothetical protein